MRANQERFSEKMWGQWWNTIREVDLNAIRREATEPRQLALIGQPSAIRDFLATLLTTDPRNGRQTNSSSLQCYPLALSRDHHLQLTQSAVLVLLAEGGPMRGELIEMLRTVGRPTLILVSHASFSEIEPFLSIGANVPLRVLRVPIGDAGAIRERMSAALLELAPEDTIRLARDLPLFRPVASRELIQRVARDNAIYTFTTGIAELLPILNVPMTLADLIVLTKNQALMVYRLALMMGESGEWDKVIPNLIPVVGGGFLWRQTARSLVSLIPGWGLVPKVAIAYAGTHVTGHAVYHWYQHGERLTPPALRAAYQAALAHGRTVAHELYRQLRTGN